MLGSVYSAMSPDRIAADRRPEFEAGLRAALQPYGSREAEGFLAEGVPVTVLVGRAG